MQAMMAELPAVMDALRRETSTYSDAGAVEPEKPGSQKSQTSNRILLIDDDPEFRLVTSSILRAAGFVVDEAANGDEGIKRVKKELPDIILLDAVMADLDGFETCRLLKQNPALTDIPIIMTTGTDDLDSINKAFAAGATDFIAKPIKNIDLQRAIELTISRIAELNPPRDEEDSSAEMPFILSDRIFVKHKEKMVKIFIEDILYIEAERNYSRIFTKTKEFLLATTLKIMEEKLPPRNFIRVHRSYMINLLQVDEVAENHVMINQKAIPLSISLRDDLMKRINLI